MFKNMGGNIRHGNFLGWNFLGGNLPWGSLIGGNFRVGVFLIRSVQFFKGIESININFLNELLNFQPHLKHIC